MKNIYVVAQEFSTPGNCGALARVMKNFNCKNLCFLKPKCDYKSKEAMDRATHAKSLLKNAKELKSFDEMLKKFDYVIATTSMVGSDYNIPRSSIFPEDLAKKITNKKFAVVIGREGEGMNNEEIKKCDFTVTIPTSKKYPTMNVSHATAIILYEIFKISNEKKVATEIVYANGKEKEALMKLINNAIERMGFPDEYRKKTQRIVWKRIIGKGMLTKREVYAMCGFFNKIK